MRKTVLLIGLGRFGRYVAKRLYELGDEVMAVDQNEERVSEVLAYVTNAQIGDSTNERFLKSLGIGNYDVCIVAIGDSFQNSLETTFLLSELGAKHIVARACSDRQEKFLLHNGADEVVYPEKQMAELTALKSSSDHLIDCIELGKDYGIFELEIPPSWIGHTIMELDIRKKYAINIMAIKRNGDLLVDFSALNPFLLGDQILALGNTKELNLCLNKKWR